MTPRQKINGVNLGNWLVLEKWMKPDLFEAFEVDDEISLHRSLEQEQLESHLKAHRDSYITRDDFANIAAHGMNLVRIPVPYFIFGDCPGHPGCIEYLDKAMDWAEECGLQVLVDLHTVPGGQNGYDNGGLVGVCRWHKDAQAVELALKVLERLAARYATRPGLYGIEVLNEPISWLVYKTAPSTGKAKDPAEAEGSSHVPLKFLKEFYCEAYERLRKILPEEKVIVFHDGFRLGAWKDFFVRQGMKNVMLDTHIYIDAMELFMPIPALWIYRLFVAWNRFFIRRASRYTPVVVGEWNLENRRAGRMAAKAADPATREEIMRQGYHTVARIEMEAWDTSAGKIYWNYQLEKNHDGPKRFKENGDSLEGWDLVRTWKYGWMPQ